MALDGLRGIAALMVAVFHLSFLNHIFFSDFLRNSYLFVDFFFVLSGFVIAHTYLHRLHNFSDFRNFFIRRIARLWPLHMATLAAIIALFCFREYLISTGLDVGDPADHFISYSPETLFANIFFLHSIGLFKNISWNYPSWSISVEFFTYIIFALFCIFVKHRRMAVALGMIFVSASILALFAHHGMDATADFGIFRCIYGFFVGAVLEQCFQALRKRHLTLPAPNFLEIAACILTIWFVCQADFGRISFLAPLVFALPTLFFAYGQGAISRFLLTKPIQDLGTLSFSIYLLHAIPLFLINIGFRLLQLSSNQPLIGTVKINGMDWNTLTTGNIWLMDALTIFYLIILVFLARFSYRYIEMPAQTAINSLATKTKATPATIV